MYVMSVTRALFGASGGELPIQDIGHHADRTATITRLATVADLRTQTFAFHQSMHAVAAEKISAPKACHVSLVSSFAKNF
ncbi:hypothetical protein PCO31110_00061 [Pandoraea communis]|uniref:Uncharacterized protein n=1 Tax=Pandoraea communis TaxID=2508297 RepID=A0A5E4RAI5_9BURK|nr:hypothetical protein PCO31110_00061 [Pandoraea communis]